MNKDFGSGIMQIIGFALLIWFVAIPIVTDPWTTSPQERRDQEFDQAILGAYSHSQAQYGD